MSKKFLTFLHPESLKTAIKRFPIPFVIILTITTLFFVLNNYTSYWNDTIVLKSTLTFILVFFFSIWIYLSTEDTKLSPNKKSLFQLFPIAFWILFYLNFQGDFSYDNDNDTIIFSLYLIWIISYVFFAPYLPILFKNNSKTKHSFLKNIQVKNNTENNNLYYQYFHKTTNVFLFGFILWWLLFALWNLAIFAVKLLFDLDYDFLNDFSSNWAIFSLSLITPLICLVELPIKNQTEDKNFSINFFFNFIIKYVFTSSIFVYFVILYTYSIKVLINFNDWPKWEVCWLVIAFSSLWYLTYIFSYLLEEKVKIIKTFRKIFPIAVIPQILMLFYAIYLRINQYDLTINRYFVVVFWISLLIISLYFTSSKKKNLMVIPIVLTFFTIIISIWPWWVFSLPEARQFKRLEENLKKAWILVNWEIRPLNNYNDIDKELSKEIYNGINYICYNSDCKKIAQMFWENTEKTKWQTLRQITEKIRVKDYYITSEEPRYLYTRMVWDIYPINIENYTYITEIINWNSDVPISTNEIYEKNLVIKINTENDILFVIQNNEIKEEISMWNLKEKIYNKNSETLSKEDMTFEISGQRYDIKLLIQNIEIINPKYNDLDEPRNNYSYVSGYALIKEL